MAEKRPGHPVEGPVGAQRVVAAAAVDVDVDEAGGDVRAAGRGPAALHLGDPPVAHDDPPGCHPVLEDELSFDDDLAGATGSRGLAHVLPPGAATAARVSTPPPRRITGGPRSRTTGRSRAASTSKSTSRA